MLFLFLTSNYTSLSNARACVIAILRCSYIILIMKISIWRIPNLRSVSESVRLSGLSFYPENVNDIIHKSGATREAEEDTLPLDCARRAR